MRKTAVVLCILMVTILGTTLVACDNNNAEKIDPIDTKEWTEYVDEFTKVLLSTSGVDFSQPFSYDCKIISTKPNNKKTQTIVKGNINTKASNTLNNGLVEIFDVDTSNNILFMYHDNNNMYISGIDGKIMYENMPINDVFVNLLKENFYKKDEYLFKTSKFFKSLFTDAQATLDKSEYVFSFDFTTKKEALDKMFGIVPHFIIDAFFEQIGIGNAESVYDNVKNLHGEVKVFIEDNTVKQIVISSFNTDNQLVSKKEIQLKKIANKEAKLDLKNNLEGNYQKKKIGSFVYEGKIDLKNGKNNIASYNIMINSNLDLLQLYNNNFNMETLSEDNYFHMVVSHYCDKNNTNNFCNTKYMHQEGSVFELAFSPRDFGTNMLYFIYNPKAILNKEFITIINNEILPDYRMKIIPDYRLFAIDTKKMISKYIVENKLDIYQIFNLINLQMDCIVSNFSENRINLSIDYYKLLSKLNINQKYVDGIRAIMGDGNIYADRIDISINKSYIGDYNIADRAIYIIGKQIGNTKKYTCNFDPSADPALSWNYYDNYLQDGIVNNNIYDKDGNKIYGEDTPISKEELNTIIGGKIKYSYVNYEGISKSKYNGEDIYTTIVDILNIEYNQNGYSKVTVKVNYPSVWTGLINDKAQPYINFLIYDIVELNIKLDVINSCEVQLNNKNQYYYGENIPNNILEGTATIHYNGGEKMVNVKGTCEQLGDFLYVGKYVVNFNILGKVLQKEIVVIPNEVSQNENSIFYTFEEVSNKIFVKNGVWHLVYEIGEPITKTQVFDKIWQKIHHKDGYVSMRNVNQKDMYYVLDNEKHYLDKELNGVWWLDSKDNVVFIKEGKYHIETNAGGLTKDSLIIIEVVNNIDSISSYIIEDVTSYRSNYFQTSVYNFDFNIINANHGTIGKNNLPVSVGLYRGYTGPQGNLSFQLVTDINNYIDVKSIEISGLTVNDEGLYGSVNLPASIRKKATFKVNVSFKQTGYYKIVLIVDNYKKKTATINVEPYIEKI